MRHWKIGLTVLTLALGLAAVGCGLWRGEFEGKVVRVIRGDTIKVQKDSGRIVRVVLAGVDSPEKGQPYERRARAFVQKRALGQRVTVKMQGRNRYGHILGVVLLPGGRNLNRLLVAEGLAWAVPGYDEDPELKELVERARRFRKGLWRDDGPVPPWEFHRKKSWRDHD
ncbi:thermonuclease family protein [Deferrisoma palaeochoriense]